MSDVPPDPDGLQRQVSRLQFTVIALLGCALLFLSLTNLAVLMLVPQFELIFEEMLGSKDKLPVGTKLVLHYATWFGGVMSYAVVFVVPAICFALVVAFRRSILPVVFSVAVMLLQIVHAPFVILALFMPLIQITVVSGEKVS